MSARSSRRSRCRPIASMLLLAACAFACAPREKPAATTDAVGREVVLPAHAARVVTLAPNLTELVYAIGAGDRLVGRDDASDFPADAKRVAAVGAMQPNVEKIVGLRPDLVLASTEGNPPALARALDAVSIPLYVVRTDRLDEIAPAMKLLGGILQAPAAESAAQKLEEEIARERRMRTAAPRVLFAVWTDPLYVAGSGTFTDDLFALTGAKNAVTKQGWPQYPLELLVSSPPDLILYPRGAITPQKMDELLARVPTLRARVVAVDEDIFQRPGPRVAAAAHALNAILDAH